jgi:hypothetical protein
MKCFWVTDRVRLGIPIARKPRPGVAIYANKFGRPGLALARPLADFVARGPDVGLVLTHANVIEEQARVVLSRPIRQDDRRALVLIETCSGIGGHIDWKPSNRVRVLNGMRRHVHFYTEGKALEVVAMLQEGACIRLSRTGDDIDDGENDWTEATLFWNGESLLMRTPPRLTPFAGAVPQPSVAQLDLPLAS